MSVKTLIGKTDAFGTRFTPTDDIQETNVQRAIESVRAAIDTSTGVINVMDFGAIGSGAVNDTPAFQAAFDYAATFTYPPPVYAPPGLYLLSTTVTITKEGQVFYGAGMKSTVLRPGMTDGSPCLNITVGPDFWEFRDFGIVTTINSTNFAAGIATGQNCVGLQAYAASPPYIARFAMSNIFIYGCATGYNICGFIATLTNLYAHYCDLGFYGLTINSTWANLRLEGCRKSFAISDADGLVLDQLLDEGAVANAVASTLDDCKGVVFNSPYWEGGSSQPRSTPYVTFGGTTEVGSLTIQNASITGSGSMAPNTYTLKFDRVDGLRFSARIADGTGKHGVETTSNCKNITEFQQYREFGVPQDASKSVSAPVNWFANPLFDAWFRGWDDGGANRATVSQETTIVRRGANALKISAAAGQNFNNFTWQQTKIAIPLRGKTIRVGAWIWVPNITEYDENNLVAFPSIQVQSYNGSVFVDGVTVNNKMANNAWNFISTTVTVQSDATRIYISAFANQAAANASGNEFIVVDSITLCEASVPLDLQMYGQMVDSAFIPRFVAGKMITFESAQPGDTEQTYVVGDLVFNSAPVANGAIGWICTTAGIGGVAVFSALPDMYGPPSATDSAIALFAGTSGKIVKNSVVTINSTGIIIGGRFLNNGLQILDTDASHVTSIVGGSNLTSNRNLTLTTGDANRNITLSGDPTLADWFDQSVKAAASPTFATPTVTGLNVGSTSTTLTESSAGVLAVEGNIVRMAGKESIWVPASAMYSAGSPSSGVLSVLSTTIQYLAYDASAVEDAFFSVAMPKSWNVGNISAQIYWTHPATTTNFGVVWNVFAIAYGDNEAISGTPYGGSGNITDTGGTTSNLYISPESSGFAAGSSPATGNLLHFLCRRAATDGSDTMAVDAYLLGAMIFYTTNAANDT